MRMNSSVPSAPITDLKPLWVLPTPRSRILIMPHGRSTSSISRIISAGSHSYFSSSIRTATPLRFIIVCGFARTTSCPANLPRPTYDFASGRVTRMPARSASPSIARKPRLCGVVAYSSPGLPRPTINFTKGSQSTHKELMVAHTRAPGNPARLLLLVLALLLGLFGLRGGCCFGSALGFAFFFLLALLDDFRLSGRRLGCHGSLRHGFFFLLERHNVREHALRVRYQLDLFWIEWQVRGAELLADQQFAHVHFELFRNIAGETFHFHFARHHFENAALHLDALGLAKGVHGNLETHAHIHRDPVEVHVQERSSHRVHLPVLHDGVFFLFAAHLHAKDRVVAGLRAQNFCDLLGVHGE